MFNLLRANEVGESEDRTSLGEVGTRGNKKEGPGVGSRH